MAKVKVRYVGIADERIITPKDVKDRGVELSGPLTWGNGKSLVIDASDTFVDILKEQGHFQISEFKDDGSDGEVIATAADPERVETVVAKDGEKPTQKSVVAPK